MGVPLGRAITPRAGPLVAAVGVADAEEADTANLCHAEHSIRVSGYQATGGGLLAARARHLVARLSEGDADDVPFGPEPRNERPQRVGVPEFGLVILSAELLARLAGEDGEAHRLGTTCDRGIGSEKFGDSFLK